MTLAYILVATFSLSLIAVVIALMIIKQLALNRNKTNTFVGFAAGVMLTAALIDLLPEAIEHAQNQNAVFYAMLAGIVVFFFLERSVVWYHHHDHAHETSLNTDPTSTLIVVGDSIHNFIDGVAIAAAFLVDFRVGIAATLAIAAHEIPLEAADFSVLVHSGVNKTKALLLNFMSGLVSVVGGITGYLFLTQIEALEPVFLAFTAGMFIYIACSDLIPDLHQNLEDKKSVLYTLPFVAGIVGMIVITKILGH